MIGVARISHLSWLWGVSKLAAVAPLMLACASAFAQPKLTATLDRSVITLGESAELSLAFEGGQPDQTPAIQVPPGLRIQSSRSANEMRIVNGRMTSTYRLNYALIPAQAGEFSIPAIQAVVDGQRVASQPLTLRVSKPGTAAADPNAGPQAAFLRMIVPKTNVFLGEVLPVELKIFYHHVITRGQIQQLPQPQNEGFSFGPIIQLPQNQNPPAVQVGDTSYRVLTYRMTATPVKTGLLTLGPVQCSAVLNLPVNRRPANLLDDFFGSREVQRQFNLASQSHQIEVLPLPAAGRPADFTGAVGNYEWIVTAGPTNVTTGDPITLKILISGEGALDALALPEFNWRDFKTYPPTTQVRTNDALGMQGVKTFEQVVAPQNADVKEVPALAFSYFDPAKKAYRTLTHAAIPLTVKPSGGGPPQPTVMAGSVPVQQTPTEQRDIAHIKPYLGHLIAPQTALIQRPSFLLWPAVPLFAWLAAWGWRKQQEALANDPKRRRQRMAANMVRRGLEDLKHQVNEPQEFFATVFRLLQEQLGERLDLPASSITEAVLEERLRPGGVSEDLIARLHELFQACNQARYAGHVGTAELNALVPKVEAALRDLQHLE